MATQTQSFLQGEVADGKYPLLRYLGGSDHSSVFLTRHGNVHPGEAAIKLLPARPGNAAAQLSLWRLAQNLSHQHLIRILDMGRCQMGNAPMLYVVTELAGENLGEIVPQRPLSAEEARDVLASVLDALAFMHSRGFVHGHIKPSNIMAVGEQLKLSSDGIFRLGDAVEHNGATSIYDPPEGSRSGASTAGDIWALGVMLVEVLTQEPPEWNPSDRRDPVPPETMPPPFPEIVRHCLRRDPKSRWSAATIQAHVPRTVTAPVRPAVMVPEVEREESPVDARRCTAWGVALVILLATILAGVKLVGRHAGAPASQTAAPATQNKLKPEPARTLSPPASIRHAEATPAAEARTPERVAPKEPAAVPKRVASTPAPMPARVSPPVVAAAKRPSAPPSAASSTKSSSVAPSSATPSSAVLATTVAPEGAAARASAKGSIPGRVLDRVMPDVPKKASNTIWGTVRVGVKVQVDRSGNVTQAELQSGGPSRYFARLSLDAAREWRFAPPMQDGKGVASVWLLHFGYTNKGMSVEPEQAQP